MSPAMVIARRPRPRQGFVFAASLSSHRSKWRCPRLRARTERPAGVPLSARDQRDLPRHPVGALVARFHSVSLELVFVTSWGPGRTAVRWVRRPTPWPQWPRLCARLVARAGSSLVDPLSPRRPADPWFTLVVMSQGRPAARRGVTPKGTPVAVCGAASTPSLSGDGCRHFISSEAQRGFAVLWHFCRAVARAKPSSRRASSSRSPRPRGQGAVLSCPRYQSGDRPDDRTGAAFAASPAWCSLFVARFAACSAQLRCPVREVGRMPPPLAARFSAYHVCRCAFTSNGAEVTKTS